MALTRGVLECSRLLGLVFLAVGASAALLPAREAANYAFRVPGDKERMALVRELITAERECCPFLTFEVTAQPIVGTVSVRVTGPPGTKDFLKVILCNSRCPANTLKEWSGIQK